MRLRDDHRRQEKGNSAKEKKNTENRIAYEKKSEIVNKVEEPQAEDN